MNLKRESNSARNIVRAKGENWLSLVPHVCRTSRDISVYDDCRALLNTMQTPMTHIER